MEDSNLPAHFWLAPSSASRWLRCPASLLYEETPEDRKKWENPEEGSAEWLANVGTLGHRMVECEFRGEILDDEDVAFFASLPQDKQDFLATGAELCVNIVSELECTDLLLETKIAHERIPKHGGTVDVIVWDADTRTLHVVDFKFGSMEVDVAENPQVMCYLNLARQIFPDAVRFLGSILQPALSDELQTWEYSQERLDQHEADVKAASEATEKRPGDYCRLCPALLECPEVLAHVHAQVRDFPPLELEEPYTEPDERPDPERVKRMANLYRWAKVAEAMVAASGDILKMWAESGVDLQNTGVRVTRSQVLAWSSGVAAERLMSSGLDEADIMEAKLKTPKQVANTLGLKQDEFQTAYQDAVAWKPRKTLRIGEKVQSIRDFDEFAS